MEAWEHLFEHTRDCVLLCDPQGRVIRSNPAAQERLGSIDVLGDVLGDIQSQKLRDGTPAQVSSVPVQRGKFQGIEVVICPEEEPVIDRELEQAYDQLEYLVDERTAQLRSSIEQLKAELVERIHAEEKLKESQVQLVHSEKMASLGQMAAGVTHEINNPIAYISSNLDLLKQYVTTFKSVFEEYQSCIDKEKMEQISQLEEKEDIAYLLEDVVKLIKESREGTQRVREIVRTLKSFARLDPKDWREADVNHGIDSMLKILLPKTLGKCTIEKHLANLPPVRCCPGQLNQVFLNILFNAIQAVGDSDGVVSIATQLEGKEVVVRIQDNGVGIPEKDLEKVFEPFYTTKSLDKGTGLGLSISQSIVQEHGGSIHVESVVGKGATFSVKLPLHQEHTS